MRRFYTVPTANICMNDLQNYCFGYMWNYDLGIFMILYVLEDSEILDLCHINIFIVLEKFL